MSVVDNITSKGGELVKKCLQTCVHLVGIFVKGVTKGICIGTTLAVRSTYNIAKQLVDGINNLIEEKRLSKAQKEMKECQRALEFKRMCEFNFRLVKKHEKNMQISKIEFSPQEIVDLIRTYHQIINKFEPEQREIVFPEGLLKDFEELLKTNPLEIETEEDMASLREKVAMFVQKSNSITELSNAVIFAVRNEEYVPNHEFTMDEIKNASNELITIFKDFESALGCQHQLFDDRVKEVEVLRKITTIENNKILTKRKIKE